MPKKTGGMSRQLVFVYGTLRNGFVNNAVLRQYSSDFVSVAKTFNKYTMRFNKYPFVLHMPPICNITGEVWSVSLKCLKALDKLEGHPTFYKREIVPVEYPNGDVYMAWLYFCDQADRFAGTKLVPTGNFIDVPL